MARERTDVFETGTGELVRKRPSYDLSFYWDPFLNLVRRRRLFMVRVSTPFPSLSSVPSTPRQREDGEPGQESVARVGGVEWTLTGTTESSLKSQSVWTQVPPDTVRSRRRTDTDLHRADSNGLARFATESPGNPTATLIPGPLRRGCVWNLWGDKTVARDVDPEKV